MSNSTQGPAAQDALLRQLAALPHDSSTGKVLSDTAAQLLWVRNMPAPSESLAQRHPVQHLDALPPTASVGCPGVPGAYTHIACEKLFRQPALRFYEEFPDVVDAVLRGEVEFGVLPVENSSAGQVSEVLDLISPHNLYICQSTKIKVEHCLCIHPDSDPERLEIALSHPQGLAQCQRFLRQRGLRPERYSNTSTAAKKVSEAPSTTACICSKRSAQLYGLRILQEGIQDHDQNYTRFLCISTRNLLLPGADTISIALSVSHAPGALMRMLTRFAACNLDLSRLLSMPIASSDFNVRFFLDFTGSIQNPLVESLLSAMYDECDYFKFLGNFSILP